MKRFLFVGMLVGVGYAIRTVQYEFRKRPQYLTARTP